MAKLTEKDKKLIKKRLDSWQAGPWGFCQKMWGMELYKPGMTNLDNVIWKLQYDLLNAIPIAIKEHKPIFIGSGHSLGKDYICGAVGPWFLHCYRPSIVLLTGPTDRQVKHTMYKEVQGHWARRRINLGGTAFANPRIEISKDWYLLGFTTKETGATKEGGGGKFQSFHSPNICVIVTEAQSVEDNIYDQIDAVTTSENVLKIFLGNPTRARGRFAAGLKNKKDNIVFNFSCLENPNYLERRTVIPGLASYAWVEDKRKRWGESDPRWIGRVLGQVPANALNFLFTEDLFNLAYSRSGKMAQFSRNRGVAVDVAGEGVDENVIMAGAGGEVIDIYRRTLMTPQETAIKAIEMCKAIDGHFILVDCDGMGIRDYQQICSLKALLNGIQVYKFHGSMPDEKSEQVNIGSEIKKRATYRNQRTVAAFITEERMKAGFAAINPKDTELVEDLMADEWFEDDRTGKLQLIDKEDIKEVLDRSPGLGDCYKMLQWAFQQNYADMRNRQDWNVPPGLVPSGIHTGGAVQTPLG